MPQLPHTLYSFSANDVMGGTPFVAIQDHLIAFHRGRRKRRRLTLSPLGATVRWPGFNDASGFDMYASSTGASQRHVVPLYLRTGDVITDIVIDYWKGAGSDILFELLGTPQAAPGLDDNLATSLMGGGAGAWQQLVLAPGKALLAGYAYSLRFQSGQSGDRLVKIELKYRRP